MKKTHRNNMDWHERAEDAYDEGNIEAIYKAMQWACVDYQGMLIDAYAKRDRAIAKLESLILVMSSIGDALQGVPLPPDTVDIALAVEQAVSERDRLRAYLHGDGGKQHDEGRVSEVAQMEQP